MSDQSCPELRAAALDGRRVPDEAHLRTCDVCAREAGAIDELVSLVRALDPPPPDRARIDDIRGALLSLPDPRRERAGMRRVPGWAWGVAGMAASAVLLVAVSLGDGVRPLVAEAPPPLRGHVSSASSTRFVHRAAEAIGAPERVQLHEGELRLEVQPLEALERFVVSTDDAEVEARGTLFEVRAIDGVLSRVHVVSGRVEVRWRDASSVQLEAGQTWTPAHDDERVGPPSPALSPPPATPSAEQPTRSASPPEARAATPGSRASERAFRDAWAAFARSDLARAAELFAEVERLAPRSALAEDALYGRCVALERADARAEAISELRRYLAQYPRGARVDEVALALAAFEAEAGDVEASRSLYSRVLSSPVDTLRKRARAGLDGLERGRLER